MYNHRMWERDGGGGEGSTTAWWLHATEYVMQLQLCPLGAEYIADEHHELKGSKKVTVFYSHKYPNIQTSQVHSLTKKQLFEGHTRIPSEAK